jgi:hypothetical protein
MSDSCQDCPAGDGRRVYRPNSPYADIDGFVSYCVILQREGVCARKLLERALEAEAALAAEVSARQMFLALPMTGGMGAKGRWYTDIW